MKLFIALYYNNIIDKYFKNMIPSTWMFLFKILILVHKFCSPRPRQKYKQYYCLISLYIIIDPFLNKIHSFIYIQIYDFENRFSCHESTQNRWVNVLLYTIFFFFHSITTNYFPLVFFGGPIQRLNATATPSLFDPITCSSQQNYSG